MAVAHVSGQSTGVFDNSSGSAFGLIYPNDTTSGNLLVAVLCAIGQGATATSVTDNKGNTWVKAVSENNPNEQTGSSHPGNLIEIWYCPNCIGGASHFVTFHVSSGAISSFAIDEFSGADPSSSAVTVGGTGASRFPDTGSIAGVAGSLLVFALNAGQALITAADAYSTISQYPGDNSNQAAVISAQYHLPTSSGNVDAGWTLDQMSQWAACAAMFVVAPQNAPAAASASAMALLLASSKAPAEGHVGASIGLATSAGNMPGEGHVSATAGVTVPRNNIAGEAGISASAVVEVGEPGRASIATTLSLLASSLKNAAARIGAVATLEVTASSVSPNVSLAAAAIELASSRVSPAGQIRAVSERIANEFENPASRSGARATVIASSLYDAISTLSATASLKTSSKYRAAAGISARAAAHAVPAKARLSAHATTDVLSQFVDASAGIAARATTIASQIVSAAAHFSASGSPRAATNLVHLHEQLVSVATLVNNTTQLVSGRLSAHATEAVTSNLRDAAASIEALASGPQIGNQRERMSSSSGARATVIASSVTGETARMSSRATVRVPAQSVSRDAGVESAPGLVVSDRFHSEQHLASDASVVASSIKLIALGVSTRLHVLASSLQSVAAGLSAPARAAVTKNRARGGASIAASDEVTVPTNLAKGESLVRPRAVPIVPQNLAAASARQVAAGAPRVTTNRASGHTALAGPATAAVTANDVAVTGRLSAAGSPLASSLLSALADLRGQSSEIVSQILHAIAQISGDAAEDVLTNLIHANESFAALAENINQTAHNASALSRADGVAVNHDLLSLAEHLQSLAGQVANSQGQPTSTGGAVASVVASSVYRSAPGVGARASVSSPNKQFSVTAWTWVQPKWSGTAAVELA